LVGEGGWVLFSQPANAFFFFFLRGVARGGYQVF